MIGPESKLSRNPHVVARELAEGEGAVLLHMASGQYHGLNPVGVAVWELIEDGSTFQEVVDGLRQRVEEAPPSIEDDVLRFVESARERDLVVVEQ